MWHVRQFGLGEIRSRFWELAAGSKDFGMRRPTRVESSKLHHGLCCDTAKRQTLWGTMFSLGSSRDESLVSLIVTVILRFLFNLFVAMVVAVIWFAGGVYWIIAGALRVAECVVCL